MMIYSRLDGAHLGAGSETRLQPLRVVQIATAAAAAAGHAAMVLLLCSQVML